MRETSTSMSMYFVLAGLFSGGSALIALADNPKFALPSVILCVGIVALGVGMYLHRLLRDQTGFLYGFVWIGLGVLPILLSIADGAPNAIAVMVRLAVVSYLSVNIGRLAKLEKERWAEFSSMGDDAGSPAPARSPYEMWLDKCRAAIAGRSRFRDRCVSRGNQAGQQGCASRRGRVEGQTAQKPEGCGSPGWRSMMTGRGL